MSEGLSFEYDKNTDVLTIEGIKYSGDIFRGFGSAFVIGQPLIFMERNDSVVVVKKIRLEDGLKP